MDRGQLPISIKPRKSTSRHLLLFTLYLLILDALVDQSDMFFHLKMPLFIGVFLIWLYRQISMNTRMSAERMRRLTFSVWIVTLAVAVVIPSIWTLVGTLSHDIHIGDAPLGLLKTFLFFAIVPVLVTEDIDLISVVIRTGVVVAIITITMFVLNIISYELFVGLFAFLSEKQNAIITPERSFSGIMIGEFYYASCPIMIFPFAYYCARLLDSTQRIFISGLMCALFGVAILASGARADILAMLAVVAIFGLRRILSDWGLIPAIAFGAILLSSALAIFVPTFGNKEESSNSVKLRHAESYLDEFTARPFALIVGEGANQAFYTKGFSSYTINTELTYFEILRIFGLPMTIVFALSGLCLVYRLFSRGPISAGVAYLMYFLVASSNPLILNSTGFMVLASLYWYFVKQGSASAVQQIRFRLL